MADRYPLVYNPSANQLQELQSGDSLDVGNGLVKNATGYATSTGTSSQFLKADGSIDSNTYLTSAGTVALAEGLTGSPSINVSAVSGTNGTFSGNVSAVNVSASSSVTAATFYGNGAQLTGIDASALKDGNDIKVQAIGTGATVTGTLFATSFSGDGSNITNAGSSLSASSGTQRVVLTSQTSGTMTQSATDSVLTYNSDTDTLNVQNLNVQGTTTTIDTAITEVDSLEVEGSVGIGTTNTTNDFGTNSLLNINASSESGRGPVYIGANKATTQGAALTIRAVGVAHTDANIFHGIHFTSAPGADWVAGKATRSGTGFFELRREDENTYLQIDQNGHIYPGADNTQDLGSSSKRFANLYTGDLNLSNEGSTNDVDGTWGSYVIQEGEDDLFLINRRTGKKYKFNLTEV